VDEAPDMVDHGSLTGPARALVRLTETILVQEVAEGHVRLVGVVRHVDGPEQREREGRRVVKCITNKSIDRKCLK